MEFNEKLKELRKQNNMTQEQLAEKLYVSRTAISKWESGKGYPNIESLKSISKVFSVSIDELLSNKELLQVAETENKSNISKIYSLIFGILDLMAIAYIFLPFYGQEINGYIYSVNLLKYTDATSTIRMIYYTVFIIMTLIGITEVILQFFDDKKKFTILKTVSITWHSLAILFFVASRQPYVTTFLFLFLMPKMVLLIKGNK
ncbi:MAG: helix-turn-helix transcriptional regulator [Clostridium sartagoforme]|nr:helix-turn-helix transcriptional regulator [Clostridium sartagoforme]